MKITRRRFMAVSGGALVSSSHVARAQNDFPNRIIKVIVPFPAGGTVDPPMRIISEALATLSGQRFVIENRSGAGGTVGADAVAKAEPDGYTLLASNGSMTIAQALYPKLPWDVSKSFGFIGNFATLPSVLFVNRNKVPARTLPEFIAFAASQSTELTYGSPGSGTASHLAAEMLKDHVKLRMRHIPYRGAAPASTDLLGGQIDAMMAGLSTAMPLLAAEEVRAIAITSTERAVQAPDIPTVSETYPNFSIVTWLGLAGPARIADATRQKLADWMKTAVADPSVSKRLTEIGVTPQFFDREAVEKIVADEVARYPDIVKRAGVTVD